MAFHQFSFNKHEQLRIILSTLTQHCTGTVLHFENSALLQYLDMHYK